MQFQALSTVHVGGQTYHAGDTVRAEMDEYVEALVDHHLLLPLTLADDYTEVPVWEMDHVGA